MLKLEHVLQALIDSGINITITGLWDDGMDFSFVSLKSAIAHDTGHPENVEPGESVVWQNVPKPSLLADAIDAKARQMFPDSGYAECLEEQERAPDTGTEPLSDLDARYAYRRDLTETLEKLYASEIDVTITCKATYMSRNLVAGGLDFAFVSYMNYSNASSHSPMPNYANGNTDLMWSHVDRASHLAERLHRIAIRKLQNTDYARQHAA
jgi:hypothetical protein